MPYIPNTNNDRQEMLAAIGTKSIDDLFAAIPANIKQSSKLPATLSELELIKELKSISGKNQNTAQFTSFLGGGSYHHFIPSVVKHITARSEFYTAYTPYQPEISQGMLQAIFEYQTLICNLTGMDVANASMYDGGTALAEAVNLAVNSTKRKRVLVPKSIHPHYLELLNTYGTAPGWQIDELSYNAKSGITQTTKYQLQTTQDIAAVIVQTPNFFGCLEDVESIANICRKQGALFIVVADPISLGILKRPGDYGADIVVGEGQSLGIPQSFGGPYLGIFAAKLQYARQMPGRIVGETVDTQGRRGFCLTLQTREQHIRRERATSNICSNEALCALAATVYMTAMGKQGLRQAAELCLQKSNYLKEKITKIKGFSLAFSSPTFKEFVVKTPVSPEILNKKLLAEGIIGGLDLGKYGLKDHWLLCTTELNSKTDIDKLLNVLQ